MWLKYGWQSRLPRGNRFGFKTPQFRLNIPIAKKLAIILLICMLFGCYSMFMLEAKLGTTIETIAAKRVQQLAVQVINEAVNKELVGNVYYQDLMTVHKDESGRLVLLQPNVININRLQANTNLLVNEALANLEVQEIAIPMGQATENKLFAYFGPKVKVKVKPMGVVQTNVINDFVAAGINQTRHILYLDIQADMQIVVPLEKKNVKVGTKIIVADNILLGEVPDFLVDIKK